MRIPEDERYGVEHQENECADTLNGSDSRNDASSNASTIEGDGANGTRRPYSSLPQSIARDDPPVAIDYGPPGPRTIYRNVRGQRR